MRGAENGQTNARDDKRRDEVADGKEQVDKTEAVLSANAMWETRPVEAEIVVPEALENGALPCQSSSTWTRMMIHAHFEASESNNPILDRRRTFETRLGWQKMPNP